MDAIADMNRELMLDGNAVAGLLFEVFGRDMTAAPAQCAGCGSTGDIGSLLAFTQAPGVVLRCPNCESIIMRIVKTESSIVLDMRGAAFVRIRRPA